MFTRYALILAVAVTSFATPSFAQNATAEQRAACTPDAFRLCASEIPSVERITACMRKKQANLSAACKAVFDKPAKTASSS